MKKAILASVLLTAIISCKKETHLAYQYADQPQVITCPNIDPKLVNEAYYVFENALLTHAKNSNRNPNARITTDYVLRNFTMRSRGIMNISDYITQESVAVFNALKETGIWDEKQLKSQSDIANCIGNNIANQDFKTTFNALRSVENHLTPILMIDAITASNNRTLFNDKALMTYIALDTYYGKFFDQDLTNITYLVEKPTAEQPNVTLKKPEVKDPHAGHNHGPNDGHNH